MNYDSGNSTGAGTMKIGHGLTHHPLHHILGQTGMLLLMLGTVSVEVLITVTELWARKGGATAMALCSCVRSRLDRADAEMLSDHNKVAAGQLWGQPKPQAKLFCATSRHSSTRAIGF